MKKSVKRILCILLTMALTFGLIPASDVTAEASSTGTKTVTVWAVMRDPGDAGTVMRREVIAPTKVNIYDSTTMQYLLEDLTGKTTTYTTSGTYKGRLLTLNGEKQDLRWRGFIKSADGTVTGCMNVRDQMPRDGDTVILTTALESYSEPYDSLPEDITWEEAQNSPQTRDLAQEARDAAALGQDSFLSLGKNADLQNVIDTLTLNKEIECNGTKVRTAWSSSNDDIVSKTGAVKRPRDGQNADVTLTAVLRDGPEKIFNVTVLGYSDEEAAVQNAADRLTWVFIKKENSAKTNIMSDLYLPAEIEGYDGVTISWKSSNAAISPDGTVTRPAVGKTNVSGITLTATVSKGSITQTVKITGLTVKAVTTYEEKLDKDIIWLQDTWAPAQDLDKLTADLSLPAKGEIGGVSIKWETSDPDVITNTGEISRDAAGGQTKTAKLTAALSSSTYKRTAVFQVSVLPWDEAGQAAHDRAIEDFTAVFAGKNFPDTVTAANQAAATRLVKSIRDDVEKKYETARAAGASAAELDVLPQYIAFLNTEASLRKLSKTITIVMVDVNKNEEGSYTSGGYLFPKSKVVIPGDAKNDVKNAVVGLNNSGANLFDGTSTPSAAFFIGKNGVQIKAADGYVWNYAIDGVRQGTFSYANGTVQHLDHGDTVTIYFAGEDDDSLLTGEYARGLPDSAQVDYNYDTPEVFDAEWLTEALILGENENRYAVTKNLSLPDKGKSGSKITWSSDKPEVISETGEVNRPDSTSSDAAVTLTAAIGTVSSKKQTKEFSMTVKAQAESANAKTLAYAAEELTLKGLDAVTEDIGLPETGFGGVSISWKSMDPAVLTDGGKVIRPQEDTEVTLVATLEYEGETRTKEFTAKVLKAAASNEEKIDYDKAALTFEAIRGENERTEDIRYDLDLPVKGPMGSDITWQSDNESVSAEGTVTRSETSSSVKLTARLHCGDEQRQVEFRLNITALSGMEKVRREAEQKIAALPDHLSIGTADRKTAQTLADEAGRLVEAAIQAGADRESIAGIDRLDRLQTKIDSLPVDITFSIVGADIENHKIIRKKLLIGPIKLRVPAGSTVSDVTQAMIKNFDSVRPGSGASYYGTILGLSQLDAGSGSGWTYGGKGEKLNLSAGSNESYVTQDCVIYWNFVGDPADGVKLASLNDLGVTQPLPDDVQVGKDLVPDTDISALQALVKKSRSLDRADWRDYGPWKNSWQKLQEAVIRAEQVIAAEETALGYEVDDALTALDEALNALQPRKLDTAALGDLVKQADKLKEEDYYPDSWKKMIGVLSAAKDILNDPYAEAASVAAIEAELQRAIERLLPASQTDKTQLRSILDQLEQRKAEEYSYASWQRLEKVRAQALDVMDDAYADEEQVKQAVTGLQNAINSLIRVNGALAGGNRVVHKAISDYRNTAEDWEIFDMILMGHGTQVNEQGYLAAVTELLAEGRYSATDLERTGIVLTALGYDITNITMPDGSRFDFVNELKKLDPKNAGVNAAAFGLLMLDAGGYNDNALRTELLTALEGMQNADGGWPIYMGEASETDMTAIVITALAPYTGEARIDKAIRKGFDSLESHRDMLTGTPEKHKGNSNSTAMAMIAYVAAPSFTDGTTLSYFGSVGTGGLYYYITDDDRLGYTNNIKPNDLATEQGVRAYIAYDRFEDGNKTPVYIYRFEKPSKKLILQEADLPVIKTDLENQTTEKDTIGFRVSAETADGITAVITVTVNGQKIAAASGHLYQVKLKEGLNSIVIKAVGANGAVSTRSYSVIKKSSHRIEVYFTLLGDDAHGNDNKTAVHTLSAGNLKTWIARDKYTVDVNATVMEVFSQALITGGHFSWNNNGVIDGTEGGYIQSVTNPDGVLLAEFTNGPKSGWMYTVNGEYSDLGINAMHLKNGDEIVFHYTDDYTKEKGETLLTAEDVIKLIEALPETGKLTIDDAAAVAEAHSAYAGLNTREKAKVPQALKDKLTAAVKRMAELRKASVPGFEDAYRNTGDYLAKHIGKGGITVGEVGGDWTALGLSRSGRMTGAQSEAYYNNVADYVKQSANGKEQLHRVKSTENSRIILALTAAGYDPRNVAGHNLLKGLTDMDHLTYQGINGPIWALIAFDSHDYDIPKAAKGGKQVSREGLIDYILSRQTADGGWDLANTSADPDMTGMALQALAPYYSSNAKVKKAVDKALNRLSVMQLAYGGYNSRFSGINIESCVQVVVALTALGIDPANDSRFIKNGNSVMDALLSYYVKGGGFCHIAGGKADGMATEQGYYALAAYDRFINGKNSLYDMCDVTLVNGISRDKNVDDSIVKAVEKAKAGDTIRRTAGRSISVRDTETVAAGWAFTGAKYTGDMTSGAAAASGSVLVWIIISAICAAAVIALAAAYFRKRHGKER